MNPMRTYYCYIGFEQFIFLSYLSNKTNVFIFTRESMISIGLNFFW